MFFEPTELQNHENPKNLKTSLPYTPPQFTKLDKIMKTPKSYTFYSTRVL